MSEVFCLFFLSILDSHFLSLALLLSLSLSHLHIYLCLSLPPSLDLSSCQSLHLSLYMSLRIPISLSRLPSVQLFCNEHCAHTLCSALRVSHISAFCSSYSLHAPGATYLSSVRSCFGATFARARARISRWRRRWWPATRTSRILLLRRGLRVK